MAHATLLSGFSLDHLWLILAWLGYVAVHSLLASLAVKQRLSQAIPHLMSWYRLAFNGLAITLLLPVFYFWHQAGGPWLWQWTGVGAWLANILAGMAIVGFIASLRWYDSAEFLGLRQWRERNHSVEDQETFQLSPFHRYVRHPWYSFALVILWTRDMDLATLISTLLINAYFVLGSRLEEHKLVQYHGAVYPRYQRAVPGLIPRPWRHLSRSEADRLNHG